MAAINSYQRKKIYSIAGALGMRSRNGDDALHDLVFGMTGRQHISELTSSEAYDVIAELEKKQGANPIPRHRGRPKRPTAPGHASEGQMRKAWALMYQLEAASPSKTPLGERLCGIIKKDLGVEAFPRDPFAWVDYKGGNKLIETLKGYVKTARKKAEAKP